MRFGLKRSFAPRCSSAIVASCCSRGGRNVAIDWYDAMV